MSAPIQGLATTDRSEAWRTVLRESAREVFSMMVGVTLEDAEPSESTPGGNIMSMIGLAGAICGILTVRSGSAPASQFAALMLGLDAKEAALHGTDAIGEICNMVAGTFKAKLGLEDKCMLSVPTVITGDDYSTHSMMTENRIEVLMSFQNQPLWFTLDVRN